MAFGNRGRPGAPQLGAQASPSRFPYSGRPQSPGGAPGAQGQVIRAREVIIFGPNGGVFVYSGQPKLGNPPVAWMSSGSTDPFANVLPNNAQMGLAGSGSFQAGNTIINPSGQFVYSGTPALGNLIATITPASGANDGLGNAYKADMSVYGAANSYVQMLAGTPATVRLGTGDANEATPGLIGTLIDGAGVTRALASQLQAPKFTGETAFAVMRLESSSEDLTTSPPLILLEVSDTAGDNSQIIIDPTDIRLIKNTALSYLKLDGVGNQLIAGYPVVAATTAGGITAETWHSLGALGAGSGYTVNNARYRLTPDGEAEIDINLTAGAATVAGVYLFANTLPAGPPTYRPPFACSYPMGWNGSVTAGMNFPSLRVSTAGAVNLQLPALPNNTVISCTQRMPTS